jgi:hypothetical protein
MYRHNGSILGKRAANNNVATIFSLGPRGRKNGSIIDGSSRLVDHLEGMIPRVSGIWRLSGMQLVDEDVDTVTVINNSYWTDPAPYQAFVETSRWTVATGVWHPSCPAAQQPCGSMWGCGGDNRNAGNAGSTWTYLGSGDTCSDPWIYAAQSATGYYQTVDPPPYYTEQLDSTTTTVTHKTWNFFC